LNTKRKSSRKILLIHEFLNWKRETAEQIEKSGREWRQEKSGNDDTQEPNGWATTPKSFERGKQEQGDGWS